MKLYTILLTLFIFGFVTSGINESGMFTHKMPETDIGFNDTSVQEITEGAQNVGTNPVSIISLIGTFFRIFAAAVIAMITIVPIFASWGVPIWAGMMIQGPVWLVEVAGLQQIATGHNFLGME